MKQRMNQLDRSKEAVDLLYEAIGSSPCYISFDDEGNIADVSWSSIYLEGMGYDGTSPLPQTFEDWTNIIVEEDRERVLKAFQDTLKDRTGQTRYNIEYRIVDKDGTIRYHHSVGKCRRRPDGTPILFCGITTDTTPWKMNYEALQEQYEIVEALSKDYLNIFMVDGEKESVRIVKLDGYVTEGFGDKKVAEYPYTPFCLKYINDRAYPDDKAMLMDAMSIHTVRRRLETSDEYVCSYRALDQGEVHFYQFTYIKLKTKNGEEKIIAGFKNIDTIVETAKEREALITLSETDGLTNIANRRCGEKKSRNLIERGGNGMFCILDVDRFKYINDTFGHSVGDKVLIRVAAAMKSAFRDEDVVFRLGGDEFAVMAPRVQYREDAENMIHRFFDMIAAIDLAELNGHKVSVSLGAVIFRSNLNGNFEDLYKEADANVYEAKKSEGCHVVITGEGQNK